jgi:hypothetical protein
MGQMNFFYGSQLGAPALGTLGTGDLARVLDAALVNGFTAQSCTISVTASVATVSLTAHTYKVGQRITIAGVTGGPTGFALLNATSRITSVATNSFTLAAAGVSNGAATGSITAQLAGLGWGIAFTATNQRAYRAASGLRHYLMVNDNSNTNTCIVRAFTAMTAVTTGTGPFPTTTQSVTNLKWPRPDPTALPTPPASGSYNDSWVVVGDDKRFLIGICTNSTGWRYWYGFGEFQSYKAADAYNTFIFGAANTDGSDNLGASSPAYNNPSSGSTQGASGFFNSFFAVARAANQTTLSYIEGLMSGFLNGSPKQSAYLSSAPAAGTASPISGGIELTTVDIVELTPAGSSYYRRGRLPFLCAWTPPDFENNDGTLYTNITNFGDLVLVRGYASDPTDGLIFPVGDWDTVLN